MTPKTYKHLSIHERDLIAVYKSRGKTLRGIALALHRDPGTLSRELQRNAPPIHTGYYLAHKAHARADQRACRSRTHPRLKDDRIRRYVEGRIRKGWSPELTAGRLPTRYPDRSISHEAIYQWIYADALHLIPFLVRAQRVRKRRGYSRKHQKAHIPDRISIRQRPRQVQERRQAGHWETDTVISRKSRRALQVSVERKTRYTRLAALRRKGSHEMSVALTRRLSRVPQALRRSITYDNGSEKLR